MRRWPVWGIAGRFGQREEYKGAADPLTRDAMSPAVRSNLNRLLASWRDQLAGAIADSRQVTVAEARRLIDDGPYLPAEAQDAGLIDRLAYLDEVRGLAEDYVERVDFQRYMAQRDRPEAPADAPKIALIYGLGPVVLGSEQGAAAPSAVPRCSPAESWQRSRQRRTIPGWRPWSSGSTAPAAPTPPPTPSGGRLPRSARPASR